MMRLQPRHLLHRGVVQASGFYFDTRLLRAEEAGQRILALWMPGAGVYRLAEGLLLCLPIPRQVCCETAPGLPLVACNGLLLAAPLTSQEIADMSAPWGALILTHGGHAVVHDLANATQDDPALWLDGTDWQSVRTTSLGSAPARPRVVAEPETFDARARLAGVPPEAPERAAVLDALRKAVQAQSTQNTGSGDKESGRAASWFQRMIGGMAGTAEKRKSAERSENFGDTVQRFAARLLLLTGLARVIGRRQAEYIGRMIGMFERGELHEALRHAIPMGALEGKPRPPALGVPTPREDLTISAQQRPARSSLCLAPDLHEHLMALYRQAFRKLEAAGQIEEAAFVLAELLGANAEAVTFLERHKSLRLAAEMAEARNLPAGLVVRQWFLVGETQRAVLIARRNGAFADAVLRLERTNVEQAQELRWLWAVSLAEAGNHAEAIEVIRPVLETLRQIPERQQQLASWIDAAIAPGGPAAARMLALKITLCPGDEDELRALALALLEDESSEAAAERLVFAKAIFRGQSTPLARLLARAAVRSTLRDAATSPARIEPHDWQRLIRFTEDASLRADMASLPMPVDTPSEQQAPLIVQIAATDCGAFPVYDAAFVPGGRCIVALGEAGLRLITRDARTVVHAEQPAHRLALADHGTQVIALAPRGEVWRLGRMNLITRRAETWREAALQAFAPDCDGSLWFVAIEKDFLAIDATSANFDALWRLPNLEGRILTIARSSSQCSFLQFSVGVTDSWGRPTGLWTRLERWTHSLPDLFLRARNEVFCPPENAQEGRDYARTLTPGGEVVYLHLEPIETEESGPAGSWNIMLRETAQAGLPIGTTSEQPYLFPPCVTEKWIVVATGQSSGVDCRVLERKTKRLQAQITLAGAVNVSIRLAVPHLTIADDRGRLLVCDLDRGELRRDLRIR
jgi:tetratricopeptide (TPR) repeat protein